MKGFCEGDPVFWVRGTNRARKSVQAIAARVIQIGSRGALILVVKQSDQCWQFQSRWVPQSDLALRSVPVPLIDQAKEWV